MKLSARVRSRLRDHLDTMPAKPRQADVAEAVGMSQSWFSHYLHGRHEVDLDTLERLCTVLSVDLESLMRTNGAPESSLPPSVSEIATLFQALPAETQDTVRKLLRDLSRPKAQKRARRTR